MPMILAGPGVASAHSDAPKSYTEAMNWYRAGAEAGDPKAQFYLGVALEQGARGRPDLPAARAWFKKAADSGHALARYKLAVMLQNQLGGSADLIEARRLYGLAGEQGIVEARYNLCNEKNEAGAKLKERILYNACVYGNPALILKSS